VREPDAMTTANAIPASNAIQASGVKIRGPRLERGPFRRWAAFNLVGLIGAGVQLAALALLSSAGLDYRTATVLAVEAAVLNNFAWHRRWTWPEVRSRSAAETVRRLAGFNLTVGLISMIQNVGLMQVLVGRFEVHYLVANMIAIGLCSFANFLVSDQWIFRGSSAVGIFRGSSADLRAGARGLTTAPRRIS
jgi:putative flippase GtrA